MQRGFLHGAAYCIMVMSIHIIFCRGHMVRVHKQGFSLVELSIVLVILGLLTGGILGGQSLIRAAELRAITTERDRYATAIGTFRDKYFAFPGDMSNATAFGTAWIGNGNGNGSITLSTTAAANENSLFWIHLAQAGLVEGSYTNVAATSTTVCGAMTPGIHEPRSKISNAGWHAITPDPASTSVVLYPTNYGNTLMLGSGTTCGTNTALTGMLKSEEAWNIDTKADDSRPDLGSIVAFESQGSATAGTGCGNAAASATAGAPTNVAYDLTNTSSTACALVFKTGY